MFTGIIQALGKVIKYSGSTLQLDVPFRRIRLGESLSIDGVCLSVSALKKGRVFFDIGPETARVTTLKRLKTGARVNLERALRVGERLGGHWVTGHVEGRGRIRRIEPAGASRWLDIEIPASLARYVVAKGSLAVDGISLTVVSRRGPLVRLMIIPHTLAQTTLGGKKAGDEVNLEPDILAKYQAG